MRRRPLLLFVALMALAAGCGPEGEYELAESTPLETALDDPAIRGTKEVWLEMIGKARSTLDIEQFYIVSRPGTAFDDVLLAVFAAARRGVRVRVVAETSFSRKYPADLARLDSADGIDVRTITFPAGGVQHAKFFIVDGEEVFVGSQNFDWRSLEHINELGVRLRSRRIADAFGAVFEMDWAVAGRQTADTRSPVVFPVLLREAGGVETVRASPVFSPGGMLPSGAVWDEPHIVRMIGEAREVIRVQLLSFASGTWDLLENALVAAAERGVRVRLLVSDWNLSPSRQRDLKRLQRRPGISVRFSGIPAHSGGFVSYARVEHCKFMTIDGRGAWIGTSNWSEDYFRSSRNAGVLLEGRSAALALARKFDRSWFAPYAREIDPAVEYERPVVDDGSGT